MKRVACIVLAAFLTDISTAQVPSWSWAVSGGGNRIDDAYRVAADAAGMSRPRRVQTTGPSGPLVCSVAASPAGGEQRKTMTENITSPRFVFYETSFEQDERWNLFEEIVNGNPCYGENIGEITRSNDAARTGHHSFRIWSNKARSNKGNHIIAYNDLIWGEGVTGRWIYSVSAYIPVSADTSNTGPEVSVQNTRPVGGKNFTFISAVQYVRTPDYFGGHQWNIWHEGRWVRFMQLPLSKGIWYTLDLEFDFTENRYISLKIAGADVDTLLDLRNSFPNAPNGFLIGGEDRNFNAKLVITLEGENRYTNCQRVTESRIYYDDVKLIRSVAPTSVEQNPIEAIPSEIRLLPNYPNPFNPSTTIAFDIPLAGSVSLTAFDLLGRHVATLVNGHLQPGRYTTTWDATGMPSGVYVCRLQAGGFEQTRKLLLAK